MIAAAVAQAEVPAVAAYWGDSAGSQDAVAVVDAAVVVVERGVAAAAFAPAGYLLYGQDSQDALLLQPELRFRSCGQRSVQ